MSNAADVLRMSVERVMRGVSGVCEMCVFGSGGVDGGGVSG